MNKQSVPNVNESGSDTMQAAPSDPQAADTPSQHQCDTTAPISASSGNSVDPMPVPPGFAGHLYHYIYHNSYLAVNEVAIAATLGLLAGVCGRAFETHTGKDLALYIILVARSGIGKDAIHDCIPKLIKLAEVPAAEYFVRTQDFASGPALHKTLLMQPGFLNLQGEFGRKLKGMSNLNNAPMQELRTVMTNAYAKEFLEGKTYSNSENSLLGVQWPAFSFLGETTPGTFSESLTPDMMEDGFMSRFLVISYDGLRPLPNEIRGLYELEPQEQEQWKKLVRCALPYQGRLNCPNQRVRVEFLHDDAYDKLHYFELECGDHINETEDESERQVWNRAHLKALKIASLLAVADDSVSPKINLGHATWAMTVIRRDIAAFKAQKKNGDIGHSDDAREKKIMALTKKYIREKPAPSYKIPEEMRKAGVIPRAYFQMQVSKHNAFNNHRLGQIAALDITIKSLIDSGYFMEMNRDQAMEKFGTHGRCFIVQRLD